MKQFFDDLGVTPSILLAAFVGSVIAVVIIPPEELTARRALLSLVCGLACSIYGTSLVAWYWEIGSMAALNGAAFILGLSGMWLIAQITALDLKKIIYARFGVKKDD